MFGWCSVAYDESTTTGWLLGRIQVHSYLHCVKEIFHGYGIFMANPLTTFQYQELVDCWSWCQQRDRHITHTICCRFFLRIGHRCKMLRMFSNTERQLIKAHHSLWHPYQPKPKKMTYWNGSQFLGIRIFFIIIIIVCSSLIVFCFSSFYPPSPGYLN